MNLSKLVRPQVNILHSASRYGSLCDVDVALPAMQGCNWCEVAPPQKSAFVVAQSLTAPHRGLYIKTQKARQTHHVLVATLLCWLPRE